MLYPRIGHINFLNVLPLTYSYQHGYSQGLSLKYEVPSVLNDDIKNDRLDISPISSIAYAKQSNKLFLLPDICIRADCEVESIVLISRKPIENISNDTIILTSKSATSHCLLKIIFLKSYGANPRYEIRDIGKKNPIPEDATASLLIGDDALYIYFNTPDNFYCYDLGKEWYKLTGHSMVYAVWSVRRKFANESPELLQFAYEKIILGMREGIKNKGMAINSVINEKPFSYRDLDFYLGNVIKWDLMVEHLKSLTVYYKMAYDMNLIRYIPKIEFAPVLKY